MPKKKHVDPLPEEFPSAEAAAEFWDTHDTTDYPEAFSAVEAKVELRRRRHEIEIDADIINKLRKQARKKGVPSSQLANDLLRQRLTPLK